MSGLYSHNNLSPARALSPQIRPNPDVESGQYLAELLEEHQKLGPFMEVLPICRHLLNQEILRVSRMIHNQGFSDFDRPQSGNLSLLASPDIMTSDIGTGSIGWNRMPHERLRVQGVNMDWQIPPSSPSSYIIKKILRLDIPVDKYPNFNFVGRLLGPRGNSLKRVEASLGCRVYIRGKGSIKDPEKEEALRGRPGYEHLTEPLHILIEAELPVNIVDMRLTQAREIIEELLKPVVLLSTSSLPPNTAHIVVITIVHGTFNSYLSFYTRSSHTAFFTVAIVGLFLVRCIRIQIRDESQDFYKRQQLRELAMLNLNYREESPVPSGGGSPFSSSGMKRAKTGQ